MTLQELRVDIHEALRVDLARARRLVASYARRAARSNDPVVRAIARYERARIDHRDGRHREAAAGYAAARLTFARVGDRRQLLATELDAVQVLALLGEADAVRRTARRMRKLASTPLQAAVAESAIGTALDGLGDERAAEQCFRRALERLGRRQSPPATAFVRATARHNLAIRLARRGAVTQALKEFDAALAFYRERGLDTPAEIAIHNRGWTRGVAGQARDALDDLALAVRSYEARGDRRRAALARLDEAELVFRLGDIEDAGRRARAAARALGPAPLEAARAHLLAARADLAVGRGAAGRRRAESARKLCEQAGDASGAAMAESLLGMDGAERTLLRTGHWIGALDALLERARALTPAAGARLLARRAARYPPVLRRWIRPDLYRLQAEAGNRIPLLRRAFKAAEDLRRRAPAGTLRATALAAHLEIYEALARALLDRGRRRDVREAFTVLDAARARTLRDELEREAPGLSKRPRLRKARERLETLWRSLERRDADPGGLRRIETRLLRDVARHEAEYIAAVNAGDAQASEPGARMPEEPCLAFAIVGGDVIGFLARGNDVASWSCGPLASLRRSLDAFLFQVTRRLHGASDTGPAYACLETLATRMLPPTIDAPALRVVLPPELGSLPVEALPRMERTIITYVPFAALRTTPWTPGGEALLVGLEDERLPDVRREVTHLRRRLRGSAVLRGKDATRERVLEALRGKRLVHLAGHAQAREDQPLLSALRVHDGWLCAGDFAGLDLRRTLVVLSACRTGDPALRWHGEAMGGFPRTLLAAGAAGVVASRWEVADSVAFEWMRKIYGSLEGGSLDDAVSSAARAVRETHPHPADWAAFLLIRGGSQ